jgi:membrane-bound lytic murein transglycosylase D
MATCLVRLAAAGAGCALLLAIRAAQAGDPGSAAHDAGHDPGAAAHPTKAPPASKRDARTGKPARASEVGARRSIAGGPTFDDVSLGAETAELHALREAERDLFPPASPAPGNAWPSELAPVSSGRNTGPTVHATGLPPAAPEPAAAESGRPAGDLSWLSKLQMPDIPVRWDDRVVRYLEFFRDDPRGHAMFANLFRHSGRYRDMMQRTLRRKSLPADVVWLAMVESGFDPTARSLAAAVGLWQFTSETAKIYGLTVDRWLDQRMDAQVETEAAVDHLGDLHRRFGSWEMAFAAYNMGYGALAQVVRRYNTNDFWSLSRTEGTLPWETTLYVPKVIATAVVANNLAAFGFGDLTIEAPVVTEEVSVPPGTSLAIVAQAAGVPPKELQALNPELRAGRTPPALVDEGPPRDAADAAYPVKVPPGKGAVVTTSLPKLRREQAPLERYVVRFGETLDQIAAARRTTAQKLVELNGISPGEAVRGGTVLLVPRGDGAPPASPSATSAGGAADATGAAGGPAAKPNVIVPADLFVFPDRRRVFYRVQIGDTLREIAAALHVGTDDLDRWNDLDPGARLQEGMTLQAFVPSNADLSGIAVIPESDVTVLPVGSDEFFAALERDKGFKRTTVTARDGDTLEAIGKRYGVSVRTMERINRRGRGDALKPGDTVVVYVPVANGRSTPGASVASAANAGSGILNAGPAPNGPLPEPPLPDLLP